MHRTLPIFWLCLLVVACTGAENSADSPNSTAGSGATSGGGASDGGTTSSGGATEDEATDGGATDGGATGAVDAPSGGASDGGAPGCGTLANTASIVSKTANPGAQPAMTGGTLRDGTYEKTSIIDYETSSPSSTRHQETWRISGSGSVFQTVQKNPADMIEQRFGATITTSGESMTLNLNCPATNRISAKYTATANEIRFSSTANEVHVYTRVAAGAGGAGSGGSSSGGTLDASDCQAVAAQQKQNMLALGCIDTSAELEAGCNSLYETKMCTAEWEPLVDCLTPRPASDFECSDKNKLQPKAGICSGLRAAFDACTGK